MDSHVRLLRILRVFFERRGPAYLSYLVYGVGWPKAAHRFGWGPRAPRLLRSAFYGALVMAAGAPGSANREAYEELLAHAQENDGETPSAAAVESLMDRAHRAGITGVRSGFNHLVRMPDGTARFRRLPAARQHRARGVLFAADRDRDRAAFNDRFNADLLTEARARTLLRECKANVPAGYRDYAPIDFTGGITVGRFLSTDSGTGRWDAFNGHLVGPLVAGKRVLDLGSNNASLPLMMLRAGARSVTGIELTPAIADFARLNARILEWQDIRAYDIRILTGDMRLCLTSDLGAFDVVTAFCSLYYLPDADMAGVIQKAARMGASLVLQANEAIDNLPAHAAQLRSLMKHNGYPTVEIHEFPGFARPLLVGRAPAKALQRVSDLRPTLMEV